MMQRLFPRMIRGLLLAIVTLVILVQSAWSQYPGAKTAAPEFTPGLESITEAQSRQILSFIAGPNTQGRNPAQPGFAVAAGYAARFLQEVGLQPIAPDGSYFQRINFVGTRYPSFSLGTPDGAVHLSNRDGTLSTQNVPEQDIAGIPVFVSLKQGGIQLPDGITLADFQDKIIVFDVTDQTVQSSDDSPELNAYVPILEAGKVVIFIQDIAAAVEIIDPTQPPIIPEWHLAFADTAPIADADTSPRIQVDSVELPALLSATGASFGNTPAGTIPIAFGQQELVLKLESKGETQPVESMNVLAMIEGSDPQLKSEVVGIGAHLDHLGVYQDGSIFNGADDNGSGDTALLNVAHAMMVNPIKPKRSVLFMLFTGEEYGLVGSEYYIDHPIVPNQQMVAYLNMDMVGRNSETEGVSPSEANQFLYLSGAQCYPNFKPLILQVNEAVGFEIKDYEVDCDHPQQGESDHINFAQANVPIANFFGGEHRDYHRPSDTLDKVNFQKLTNASKLMYLTVQELANQNPLNLRSL